MPRTDVVCRPNVMLHVQCRTLKKHHCKQQSFGKKPLPQCRQRLIKRDRRHIARQNVGLKSRFVEEFAHGQVV
jgi:hypothetical protein